MKLTVALLSVLFLGFGTVSSAAELVVREGFVIVTPAGASPQTVFAAKELQRVIERSTGFNLKLTTAAATSSAIKLTSDNWLPRDGYEIRIENNGIVIAGNESEPKGMWDLPSHGILYGAIEFMERFVGVRWLLPGELGEDVPRHGTLRIELNEPRRGSPGFSARSVAYMGESDRAIASRYLPVIDWMTRLRLTNALHPQATGYGHSWDDYIKPSDLQARPEWKPSNGEAVRNGRVTFFCTTAPGIVELFAQRVIESIDRNPKREMTSISPTDGGGFCTCERCKPLLDTDPHGKPNHARAILTFYKRVGEIVARERPGHRLGGFVYYNYQYPPADVPHLPDNVSLCWAPLNYYGYGLLKPVYRAEFEAVMRRWSEVTPHFFYHNYSTWMRSFHGAPLPVGLEILRRELPAAAQSGAWGARMVGTSAWGVNAPINYLLAKQLWTPQLDVSATLNEWLERAYGPGWRHLRSLYDELDARMLAHKEPQSPVYKGSQYEVNEDVMKSIYAPIFPTMERRYRATLAECATDAQRARLRMFGDNLTQLHFALRKAGLIAGDTKSRFYLDDAAFAVFLKRMEASFSLHHDKHGVDHGPIWKGEWRAP